VTAVWGGEEEKEENSWGGIVYPSTSCRHVPLPPSSPTITRSYCNYHLGVGDVTLQYPLESCDVLLR